MEVDQKQGNGGDNRKKAKYDERKLVAKLDRTFPYDEDVEYLAEAATTEIREFGVRCDKNVPCTDSVHNVGDFAFGLQLLDVYSVKITIKDHNRFPSRCPHVHGVIRLYNP